MERLPDAVVLSVKVVPGASRTRYAGEWDGHAKLAVAAPAEKGKANKAVIDFLAKVLRIRRGDLRIVSGQTSAVKRIRIEHVAADDVRAALQLVRS